MYFKIFFNSKKKSIHHKLGKRYKVDGRRYKRLKKWSSEFYCIDLKLCMYTKLY